MSPTEAQAEIAARAILVASAIGSTLTPSGTNDDDGDRSAAQAAASSASSASGCRGLRLGRSRDDRDGRRVVLETPAFVAFQPFAAVAPFETWIMPRTSQPAFGDAHDAALERLAPVLRTVLGALADVLDDPDYNAIIQSREYFVWHLRIVPRLAIPAGFELGSGMPINPTLPEETADALRRAVQEQAGRGGPVRTVRDGGCQNHPAG